MRKFAVYQDNGQWIPLFKWMWYVPETPGDGHGPYPARWMARLAGWLATR